MMSDAGTWRTNEPSEMSRGPFALWTEKAARSTFVSLLITEPKVNSLSS